MKNSIIVVDANLAVFTVVVAPLSTLATHVWTELLSSGASFHAPVLWVYETTSVIRRYWASGVITEDEAGEALSLLDQMPIHFVIEDFRLRQAALSWADRLHQKAAYDGFYLAASEHLRADFWTADQALANNARQKGANWVHWMGEVSMK